MEVMTYRLLKNKTAHPYLVKESVGQLAYEEVPLNASMITLLLNSWYQLGELAEEFVYLLCFKEDMQITGVFELSHGTVNMTAINSREVMIRALLTGSTGIILAHNHPSGSVQPSSQDGKAYAKMKQACELMHIKLHDFIIIGGKDYLSFHDESIREEKLL